MRAARLIVGGMVSSPGDLMCAHADLPPVHLAVDKLLQKAAVRYATLPPTHPLYDAIKNAGQRHVRGHPHPLHFPTNGYKDVRQHLVEEIPAVLRPIGWKPKIGKSGLPRSRRG